EHVISEDLEEVRGLSDRIAVIYEGRIVGILNCEEASEEVLGLMMSGAKEVAIEA
ncbi:MAG: heme ABC transporter ATP-binding protein, partial [Anaerolineaceae bacterium]|nr:heme ABC transporter ATP-binding protein [Anaerolineaceae bacterium]